MILGGVVLAAWTISQMPMLASAKGTPAFASFAAAPASPLIVAGQSGPTQPPAAESRDPAAPPVHVVGLAEDLPAYLLNAADDLRLTRTDFATAPYDAATATARLDWNAEDGEPVFRQYFVAATRFDTIDLNMRMNWLERAWQGGARGIKSVAVLSDTVPALTQILGAPGPSVSGYATRDEVVEAAWSDTNVLVILPFDELVPRLAVYMLDGQIAIENAAKFNPSAYPLVATVYAHPGPEAEPSSIDSLVDLLPDSNRDPSRLTVVAMTGVTAMVRLTAEQMDASEPDWPAQVVGPELAAADLTAISNEVPFVPGCETNTDRSNLVFCSKPEYMATLQASGADVIGLTGNHQNDFGLEAAITSLDIYAEEGLPVYGGGADLRSAMAPLIVEHNGNRLAFLGANSYGPPSAWATDFSPGSAPFDLAVMSATIRELKEQHSADVVLTELQYQESYAVQPLLDQQLDFGALTRAGADIVTGVQSHVVQGLEFLDDKLILYGLGNLYFDQMWDEATREGLIVKHTIYEGRHISTQLLPTLLHDYGQPRWADPKRRATILAKAFAASTWQ
jgi:poly-gamma-glutamate synthesis protein (capsule biosynthesis protein)